MSRLLFIFLISLGLANFSKAQEDQSILKKNLISELSKNIRACIKVDEGGICLIELMINSDVKIDKDAGASLMLIDKSRNLKVSSNLSIYSGTDTYNGVSIKAWILGLEADLKSLKNIEILFEVADDALTYNFVVTFDKVPAVGEIFTEYPYSISINNLMTKGQTNPPLPSDKNPLDSEGDESGQIRQ